MATELDPSRVIRHAKSWLTQVYADEKIENLGLEEVRFQDGTWEITLGFDRFKKTGSVLDGIVPRREYKVIVLSGDDSAVIEMRNREPVVG